jgi:hypothetical protein
MASSASLTVRAVLALVLLVGFYVMAIAIALGIRERAVCSVGDAPAEVG